MTVTTAVPATIDYLVNLFTTAATLGAATPPVTVWDGPVAQKDWPALSLAVGVDDPDYPGAPAAATSVQDWAALGARARDELFTVHCTAEAWSGDTVIRDARVAVYGIVAAAEVLLQADVTLGGTILFLAPGSTRHVLRQNNMDKGAVARVTFDIDCKARIGH